jgi:hypothetical protein
MNDLTPVKFLEEQGIDLKATSLIVYSDGAMRQPSLTALMDGYYMAKSQQERDKADIDAVFGEQDSKES